jgi:hypothetical protein
VARATSRAMSRYARSMRIAPEGAGEFDLPTVERSLTSPHERS